MESTTERLVARAIRGEWDEVKNIYRDNPSAHMIQINKLGETALHMAVLDGKEEVVEELVDICKDAPKIKDNQGNTPLHIAAGMGSVRMCKCIAEADKELVGVQNQDTETPFLLAAIHGRTSAFHCLRSVCGSDKCGPHRRSKDGDTILHCAIAGKHFDLAYQIILLYKDLVNTFNDRGLSPLHLLANTPRTFKSGTHITLWNKIIYYCIYVDELKLEQSPEPLLNNSEYPNHLENYDTCVNCFRLLWKVIQVAKNCIQKDAQQICGQADVDTENPRTVHQGYRSTINAAFPPNYATCCFVFERVMFVLKKMWLLVIRLMAIFGLGHIHTIGMLQYEKEMHTWSVQVMNELLQHTSMYNYKENGRDPMSYPTAKAGSRVIFCNNPLRMTMSTVHSEVNQDDQNSGKHGEDKNGEGYTRKPPLSAVKETPILVAAKNGVQEMVEKILEHFPEAIYDMNTDQKNIVLLAVENRQPHVYIFLRKKFFKEDIFSTVDNEGNSALHLAAKFGGYSPWPTPNAALQMQWEIKWYEFVLYSVPLHFFVRHNKMGKTPKDIFTETHRDLFEKGDEWVINASESSSVVATLVATVAFAASATVPGGFNADGTPALEDQRAFNVFAISSLIALCFSVSAVVMFLAILTSRYQLKDYAKDLPKKLLVGLTLVLISIAFMLISFCAGHYFILGHQLKSQALPIYAVAFLSIIVFSLAQFPLYFDVMWANFKWVPQRRYIN